MELTPFPVLPVELVYAIIVEAAHDHLSARRLVLVSRQVKWQVERVLYANVYLGDMTAIRLFARTVRQASLVPRLPHLRLGATRARAGELGSRERLLDDLTEEEEGTASRGGEPSREREEEGTAPRGREPSRERLLDDLTEEEEGTVSLVANPPRLPSIEKPAAPRIRPSRLSRRWSQPPPSSSSSSALPSPTCAPPSSTTPTSISSTLTRAFFATAVRALTLVVQEEHFRILFPDVLDCARLILCACDAVRELEISGDLIRRTDPASTIASVPSPMGGLAGSGVGPPVLPPIPTVVLHDNALLPSTSTANPPAPPLPATVPSAPPMLATSTPATPALQTDLYAARMRPTHLTLIAPHNNVNYHLPMLQHVTHLRYAICPPRILGWRSNNDGSVGLGAGAGVHATGGHAVAHINVAGAGPGAGGVAAMGRGRLLRRLTHLAFDYQIGREGGHGGMGIGAWGAGNFVAIVREALAAGGSPTPPPPLDGGVPLAPHAEDGEGDGNAQGSGSGSGLGQGEGAGAGEGANGDGGAEGTLDTDALDYLDELGEGPPLERVVVKIILRPRAEMLSKFNAIWPRLDALRKADARLVYFGAKWRDNEMFGENLWERVRAVEERRDRDRERMRVRGAGSRQRTNSAASSATGGATGGRRRRASSVSIGWFQDG